MSLQDQMEILMALEFLHVASLRRIVRYRV